MPKSMIRLLSFADVISIINAIFGILAILFLFFDRLNFDLRLQISFSFILLALLADGLDGIVARRFKRSELGEHIDSMADMTSMIIAISIFIFVTYYQDYLSFSIYRQIYLIIALILFLSFGTIRLASYYIMKDENYFIGLPAPAGAIILLLLSFFKIDFILILPAVIIIGAAMASDIKFLKMRLKVNVIAAILIILTLIFYKNYSGIIPLLLLFAILTYSIGGPIYIKFFNKKYDYQI